VSETIPLHEIERVTAVANDTVQGRRCSAMYSALASRARSLLTLVDLAGVRARPRRHYDRARLEVRYPTLARASVATPTADLLYSAGMAHLVGPRFSKPQRDATWFHPNHLADRCRGMCRQRRQRGLRVPDLYARGLGHRGAQLLVPDGIQKGRGRLGHASFQGRGKGAPLPSGMLNEPCIPHKETYII